MNELAIKNFTINDEREAHIWNDCLFVFDTSALLDLYFLQKNLKIKYLIMFFQKLMVGSGFHNMLNLSILKIEN